MTPLRLATALFFTVGLVSRPCEGRPPNLNPEVFVRAEDRERARMIDTPCTESDVGRGCFRFRDRLLREYPCSYHIDENGVGSLPTDQCFVMESPRVYRGVWINEFEGQQFIPSGATMPRAPGVGSGLTTWDEYIDATIWLNVGRVELGRKWQRVDKAFIEFVGRKTKYAGHYGHMGMSGNEIILDKIISIRKCPRKGICG